MQIAAYHVEAICILTPQVLSDLHSHAVQQIQICHRHYHAVCSSHIIELFSKDKLLLISDQL